MPLKVQPIYTDSPGGLPATFTLPPSLDLELSSVRARVSGAAAAAAFIVVCEILTSDGRILAQSPIDQEFAVGDTGALSWAPFLRQAASSTPTPPGTSSIMYAIASLTNFSVGAGITTVDWSSLSGPYNPAYFELNGSGELEILDEGVYLISYTSGGYTLDPNVSTWTLWDVNQIAGTSMRISTDVSGAPDEAFASPIQRLDDPATAYDYAGQQGPDGWFAAVSEVGDTVPQTLRFQITIVEDNVDIAGTPDLRLNVIRLGSAYV